MPRGVYVRKEETKRRISAALTGRIISPDWRAKISASKMGRETSLETRAKLSAAGMGHDVSPETRAKMSVARTGKFGGKLGPMLPSGGVGQEHGRAGQTLNVVASALILSILGSRDVKGITSTKTISFISPRKCTTVSTITSQPVRA